MSANKTCIKGDQHDDACVVWHKADKSCAEKQ